MAVQDNNIYEEVATLAGGCFWCIESAFNCVKGVKSATSGYMGGHIENPSYEDICTGKSGHAEVVQLVFDNRLINYTEILEIFFTLHNPTQLNRQGNDVGTQYRSAIFTHSLLQHNIAHHMINQLNDEATPIGAIVTEISAVDMFYCGEAYHQGYVSKNPSNPYCQAIVLPKLRKFRQTYHDKLK